MQFLPMADKTIANEERSYISAKMQIVELSEFDAHQKVDEVCCGGPPSKRCNPFERPGYDLKHYIRAFVRTEECVIPLVNTKLNRNDKTGTLKARLGISRDEYRVAPGLYGAGSPDGDSPVIVTANYKLTFDKVRMELESINCWILVLDTCGINVWCAAGKNTFSTEEIINRVEVSALASLLNHRRLILPQLGASGVAAHEVKLKCGFNVIYGPVRISDLPEFLNNNLVASKEMRAVTFSFRERFELIPVELYLFGKRVWWIFFVIFILAGIGPSIFSLSQVWQRGLLSSLMVAYGGFLGTILVPLLLPWIPGRSFSFKGGLTGLLGWVAIMQVLSDVIMVDKAAYLLLLMATSSYFAMNFTGSTPYTSPSGVEKEMKIAIPMQLCFFLFGTVSWLISPFL